MRYGAGMSGRILVVLFLALAACGGHRSVGAGFPGDRSPYVWRGDGTDAAIDVVNGITNAAWIAATQDEPAAPLCTPETESGNPPHTCPAKAGEHQAAEPPR
jgi:hypothetical protein